MQSLALDNLLGMLLWLGELAVASYFLSNGAEHLSAKYGAKLVGRTLLSVATTLPEIAIVISAATVGAYGTAIGAGLGSNVLMMTLGLALMLLIATTRLSKKPVKSIDVSTFKIDKIFLVVTAVVGALLFIDGYTFIDGVIFSGLFAAYILAVIIETKKESRTNRKQASVQAQHNHEAQFSAITWAKAILFFVGGTVGIFVGASPFVSSLQALSVEAGISVVVLSVIISPIAGEMPEKISMMLLARKGGAGASIAVANVLGSKILNNTLLLALAVFGAVAFGGVAVKIPPNSALQSQMILATVITIAAIIPMLRKQIGLKTGILLAALYIVSLAVQFLLPQDLNLH